jgi:hypothetical protein
VLIPAVEEALKQTGKIRLYYQIDLCVHFLESCLRIANNSRRRFAFDLG